MVLGFRSDTPAVSNCVRIRADGAENPHIIMPDGVDWDVESWMQSLSDDLDVRELLWQTLGAIIRPNVPWHRSVWLYSKSGNNGKGTLCRLMRNLCGEDACASISITGFGNQYGLSALTRVSAVIVDENDTSAYLDKAAALKAVITGDPVLVDRKFKDPLNLVFHGFMVQCINVLTLQGQVGFGVPPSASRSDGEALRGLRAQVHRGRLSGMSGCA